MPATPDEILTALRVDIDRIDASMHGLLMQRGDIIGQLIAVKAQQGGGSAFRPGREAEMMRRIAERHAGPLPLDTVESIWRVIISTFTFVQAPYAVHADMANGDAAMRDTARFHFGFTVPLLPRADGRAVIAAVAAAEGDLGIVPVAHEPALAPWWPMLRGGDAPKIIARLPFVERKDHPAGLPVFVIARPSAAAAVHDVVLFAVSAPGGAEGPGLPPVEPLGAMLLAAGTDAAGETRLVSVPGPASDRFVDRLHAIDPTLDVTKVGSHAARFTVSTDTPAGA